MYGCLKAKTLMIYLMRMGIFMNNKTIKRIALANGFSLKIQVDGSEDLNPYVYEFARALLVNGELLREKDVDKRRRDAFSGELR